MSGISEVHQIAPIIIDDGVTPIPIGSIMSLTIRCGQEPIREIVAGNTFPTTTHIGAIRPVMSFTTLALAEALDNFGLFAMCPADATSIKAFTAARECAGIKSGSHHDMWTMGESSAFRSLVICRALRCQHRENAILEYDVYSFSEDGATEPLARTPDQALPTYGDDTSRFTLGPNSSFGGNAIINRRSVVFTPNAEIIQEAGDSDVYDTFGGFMSAMPTQVIVGTNPAWFTTFGLEGVAGTHGNSVCYLRKRGVADATAEHISITNYGKGYCSVAVDGRADEVATSEITIEADYDGTNDPYVVDTAVALS